MYYIKYCQSFLVKCLADGRPCHSGHPEPPGEKGLHPSGDRQILVVDVRDLVMMYPIKKW